MAQRGITQARGEAMTIKFRDIDGRRICIKAGLIACVMECVIVDQDKHGISRKAGVIKNWRGREVKAFQVQTLINGMTLLVSGCTARRVAAAMGEHHRAEGEEWKDK